LFQKLVSEQTAFEIVFDVTLDRKIKKLPEPKIIVKFKINGVYRFCCFLKDNIVREDIPVNKYERKMILDWIKERDIHHLIQYEFEKIELNRNKREDLLNQMKKLRTAFSNEKLDITTYFAIKDKLDIEFQNCIY
jgi:hypothetical protein